MPERGNECCFRCQNLVGEQSLFNRQKLCGTVFARSDSKSAYFPNAICPYAFIINSSDIFSLLGNVLWALWPNEKSNSKVAQCRCRSLSDVCWHKQQRNEHRWHPHLCEECSHRYCFAFLLRFDVHVTHCLSPIISLRLSATATNKISQAYFRRILMKVF